MTRVSRRGRRAQTRATGPMMLHIFSFTFEAKKAMTLAATVLIRSRDSHTALIGQAYNEAAKRGSWPFLININSVPAPRPTPLLDRLCRLHTASPSFLELLTAPAGYRPSIRLDLTGTDGRTLADAYDAWQIRWGDPRRALVWPCRCQEGDYV